MKKNLSIYILVLLSIVGSVQILKAGNNDEISIAVQISTGGIVTENNIEITSGTSIVVTQGLTKTFSFTPAEGYEISSLTFNGTSVKSEIADNQYTTPEVNENSVLAVNFKKIQYKITINTGGSNGINLYYEYGSTPSFDFTPSLGSTIQSVFYNGIDVSDSLVDFVYNVPAITANGTLVVNFVSITTKENALARNQLKIQTNRSQIIVEGTSENDIVSLYSLSGKLLQTMKSNGSRIEFTAQPNAAYILKAGNKTIKIKL